MTHDANRKTYPSLEDTYIEVRVGAQIYFPRQTVMWLFNCARKTLDHWSYTGRLVPTCSLGNLSLYSAADVVRELKSHYPAHRLKHVTATAAHIKRLTDETRYTD